LGNCHRSLERYAMRIDKRSELCREFFSVLLPAIRYVAKSCGYAVGVHGSQVNDLDLICAPWRDLPVDPEDLIIQIERVVKAVIADQPFTDVKPSTKKPCGRLAYVIHLTPEYGDGPYLDISVMTWAALLDERKGG
jgi:hypothetical protein